MAFLLLFVHCTSWLLGILSVNFQQLVVIQYLFATSNSLQGLAFLLVYSILDDKVKKMKISIVQPSADSLIF